MRHTFTAAASGSSAAREQLFAERFEGVFAFLRMALPDPSVAEQGAVDVLVTAVERHSECPAAPDEVDPWLRGIALEQVAAAALRSRPAATVPASAQPSGSKRLAHALAGVNDTNLAAVVRALDPITRQAVVLGAMAGLDDATVAAVVGVGVADVVRIQTAGLAEIARLLERYDRETEEIGELARANAYHLRPKRGPMSDGMIVVKGTRAMVERGPGSGFLYMALKAFARIFERFVRMHPMDESFDDDVGEISQPKTLKRTAASQQFAKPKRTPSLTDYSTPKATPGMAGYRSPKATPSTERLSSPARTAARAAAYGGMRKKF